MTTTYADLASRLTESLHPSLAPVAITLTDILPEGVQPFDGRVPAGCSFWQLAATQTFSTVNKDHETCAIGVYTHNLEGTPAQGKDLGDALKIFADLGYLPPSELPKVAVAAERRNYVVYSPLAEAPLAPDVVLLFVRPSQQLILSEAAQSVDGGTPPAMGRPACSIVAQAKNSQMAALSLGCCGARAYIDALTDDVALFALPGPRLEAYVARIEELAKANGILSQFHQLRRRDIAAGKSPTVLDSLAVLQAGG